ncbi:unnamed protein product [Thlaspi arvense]|uniref:Uncharacterized protein n=1 Tax=Thlaspi arvense TaxID=13288 RepID=A0AAU9RLA9_THLAR|nr:unnamed protein product [Thlaspi arvense]
MEESKIRMVEWVWELYGRRKLLEAVDPRLCEQFEEQEMERLMVGGLWCAHPDHHLRPSIKQAIQVLNFEAPLPNLPAKMPASPYLSPPDAPESSQGQTQSSSYTYNTNSSAASSPSTSLLYRKTISCNENQKKPNSHAELLLCLNSMCIGYKIRTVLSDHKKFYFSSSSSASLLCIKTT